MKPRKSWPRRATRCATRFRLRTAQFGQPVMLSEVIALVQAVAGVVAVDLDSLYRTGNDA